MPHLTLSFGSGKSGQGTSGDLSALSLGLACLVSWAVSAGLGMPCLLAEGGAAAVQGGGAFAMRGWFLGCLTASLLFVGCTNQRYLRFYVGRAVLAAVGLVSAVGTICAALSGMEGAAGLLFGCIGSALMGAGAGVLLPLWGTAFARDEFNTITLNSAAGAALGIVGAVALMDWLPAVAAIPVETLLVCASVLLLMRMTPIPYYRRREIPIFHALRVSRVRFLLHLGIPVVLFGVVLGVLGAMAVNGAFCTGIIANDLLVGASCALCLVLFIVNVAMMKDEAHWDTLFRYMLPAVGLGLIGIPLFCGAYQMGAVFLLATGLVILLVLLWVMFGDMSQEFRLSPLFVFGVGGGLLLGGVIAGALLVPTADLWQTMSPVRWTGLAMGAAVLLMLAGSINPRKRDVVKMLAEKRPIGEMAQLNRMMVDDAAKRGEAATDEQIDAAGGEGPQPDAPSDAGDAPGPAESPDTPPERAAAAAAFAEHARLLAGIPPRLAGDGASAAAAEEADGASEAEPKREKGSFYRRCEEIADRYLLSRRETEVLFLLAKGHKAGFIEDKLCVSRSTAKTHINHIYKKLDIHTQQELLNMVEDRPRPHAEEAASVPLHHGF